MTTIVGDLRAGVLACDSRLNMDDAHMPCTKVVRVGDSLIGCAGDVVEELTFMRWFRNGRVGKTGLRKDSTFAALVLSPEGLFYLDCYGAPMACERGFHAIGSGGQAATAAMLAGAGAERACEIACEVDLNSGFPVRVHSLKETT